MNVRKQKVGQFYTLDQICKCTNTYKLFADQINPYPANPKSIQAYEDLFVNLFDPIIENYGIENLKLSYGFCSIDLMKKLQQKNPQTGIKYGRIAPKIDQHMSYELNINGNRYCKRGGAAVDFSVNNVNSFDLVEFIASSKLPFDRLYIYGQSRPIHLSYGPENSRYICEFSDSGMPISNTPFLIKLKKKLSS